MSGVSGYVVDEWINGGWQRIGNFGSGVTSDPVTGLSPGTTYYFNVGASNSTGTTWGNSQSDATLDVSPPAAPSFTLTAVSSTQINIAWSDVSGAGGYAVEEWINGGWSQIDNVSANSNAVNGGGATTNAEIPGGNDPVTGLSPDTTYDFRVGAYNSGGTSWAIDQTATTLQSTAFLTGSAWSGYVIVPGSQVTQVSGSWVLPADIASTGADSRTAIWVGIDGYGGKTVEQIGTTWHASTGTWTAWVELAGDAIYNAQGVPIAKGGYYASQTVTLSEGSNVTTIQPGDTIIADVMYLGDTGSTPQNTSEFYFSIGDEKPNGSTSGWVGILTTEYVLPARTTGEWIVEAPVDGVTGNEVPLANFSPVSFSGAWATTGGTTGPINDFLNVGLDMIQPASLGGTDSVSGIVNTNTPAPYESEPSGDANSSFTVTYGGPIEFVTEGSTVAQSSNTPSSASSPATVGGSVTMAQLGMNQTINGPASTAVPSTPNVDSVAVDEIMGTLGQLDGDSDAVTLGRLAKGNGLGKNLAQSELLDLSLADPLAG